MGEGRFCCRRNMPSLPSIVDSTSPPPLACCLQPLYALDQYIAGLSVDQQGTTTKQTEQHRQDEILRVTDFLYGSCLDGALQVLEQNCTITDNGSRRSLHNITQLQSPQRSLFLVKGSSSSRGQGVAAASCYLCILPESFNAIAPTNDASDVAIYYCSCRSFLERSRSSNSSGAICKHLLALKLMPILGMSCANMVFQSEEEFSRAVMQRLPRL